MHGYALTAATKVVGLKIAGKTMPVSPAPNTTVALPGIGSVTLNAQGRAARNGSHIVAVTAVKITVSGGHGIPAGVIVIGHAQATLHDPVHALVSGSAYGTRVAVGSTVRSGPTAPAYLPCGGTSNGLLSNSTATAAAPHEVTASAVRSRARSSDTSTATIAVTSNHLAKLNLLDGVITATAITARAQVMRTSRGLTRSSAGTALGGLRINGKSYNQTPKRNTTMTLPGIGTLYLNRVITTHAGLHVVALELILGRAHGSLPAGASIIVASSSAAIPTP